MKRVLFICLLGLFLVGISSIPVQAELMIQWQEKDFQLSDFQDIYIYRLDLRQFRHESYDDEDGQYDNEAFADGVLEEVGNELYVRFSRWLKGILFINQGQDIDKGKQSLVLELKLEALFQTESRGLLMEALVPGELLETQVAVTGTLTDSISRKPLMTFTDKRPLAYHQSSSPLEIETEKEALYDNIDFWARRFAQVMAEKKLAAGH